ncbi:cation-transporting atpase plant [Dorcoceras hygrometricum]|uniref:Cation-transporting atpase plant n=1 Tax=Dorcoceras hygrometricum TaxID=472368 RepID=A0A2Z7BUN9_9LAMI|nr:cation-transporting atpase plant [Dorcoceras hygrometricum]
MDYRCTSGWQELVYVCAIWLLRARGDATSFGEISLDASWSPDIPYLLLKPLLFIVLDFFRFRRFKPPFGAKLVALGSSLQVLPFDTTLEPWVDLSREREVFEAFKHFRDYRPIVLLFRLRSGRSVNNVQYSLQIADSLSLPSTDSVTADPVVNTMTDSIVALDTSQRSPDADLNSPSSYSDSPMRFTTDDIPLGDETTVVLPPDLTSDFAQLRASVDQISLERVQTKIQIARLKAEFFAKISILETLLLSRADNQDRAARVQIKIFRKEVKDQKASLCKEFEDQLAVIRNDLLEFRVETQEQYTTLHDNLTELIAFFNRGRGDKKGEVGSSQGQGPQPPPDDRNRPGGGGGSRSEPAKKRGSSSQSGGGRTRQRGFRYWLTRE